MPDPYGQHLPDSKGVVRAAVRNSSGRRRSLRRPESPVDGGLVPVLKLAQNAGLRVLADELFSVPTDKGANAG